MKIILFIIFTVILGNPFTALLVLLIVLYFLDRRFVGFLPNLFKPIRTARQITNLKQELKISPFNHSLKGELARLYLERKKYADAKLYLEEMYQENPDSDEIRADLGVCYIKLGDVNQGEELLLQALKGNPRVKYGAPYLYLAEAFTSTNVSKATQYMEQFKQIQSSSCEAYYRLGQLYEVVERKQDAIAAYQEAVEVYRALPKYKKKTERRFAFLAWLKRNG